MTTALLALVLTLAQPGHAGTWPLDPRPEVVRRFDPPAVTWLAGHRGVDLLGEPGRPVHASLAGTVLFAGELAGRGVVVVTHGEERTTYEPVEASVRPGETVATGVVVGRLEPGAASHCFPRTCLHWGRIRNADDVYLDPLALVGAGPVRLLPLAAPPQRSPPAAAAAPAPVLGLRLGDGPADRRVVDVRW